MSAHAQGRDSDISGRWTSPQHGYVLDITRCAAEWCGIMLKADKSCGALALRLAAAPAGDGQQGLSGTLNLDPAAQTYQITARTSGPAGGPPIGLTLIGNPNTPPQPMTRMILFHDNLVRGAEAVCQADGKVS